MPGQAHDKPTVRARGLIFEDRRRVAITEVDLQEPAEGEVMVRTVWSGISSGTEMLAYRGELDSTLALDEQLGALRGSFDYPFRYGYSCVGRVERSRSPGLREGRQVFAFHPHQDLFVVAADDVIPVDDVDSRQATLFPLVETALQVTLDAGSVLEEVVVVMGLGAIGMLSAVLLQRAGARVIGVDPLGWRRTVAEEAGLEARDWPELHAALSAGGRCRVPLVVEASGQPEAARDALALLDHEGEMLVVSWYGTKEVPLPLGGDFHRRRLVIRSTQVSTIPARLSGRWNVARRRLVARSLLASLPVGILTTHDFPFQEAAEAFAAVDRGESGLVHAALCYT
jgi:2-desacetyl-2-hydroxyethyl bacteriochlorophyllide A dehydrogenase